MNYGIYWSDISWDIRSRLIDEKLSQFGAALSNDYIKTRVIFPDEASYTMFLLRYA